MTNYLDAGGRIFTTDFQYTWYRYSPDPNMGAASAATGNYLARGHAFVGGRPQVEGQRPGDHDCRQPGAFLLRQGD